MRLKRRHCTFSLLTSRLRPTIILFLTRFGEFLVLSLDDFVGGSRDEPLLGHIGAHRKYLTWMEQYLPGIEDLFMSMVKHKNWVS